MSKPPRQTLEWLCSDQGEFWNPDATVNIYALSKALKRWAKEKGGARVPAQSTLARLYAGASKEFDTSTAEALSEFFGVPVAIIRGEVQWNPEEVWGLDITYAEIRLLSQLRLLGTEQRRTITRLISEMVPPGKTPPTIFLSPQPSPLLPPPKRPEKH